MGMMGKDEGARLAKALSGEGRRESPMYRHNKYRKVDVVVGAQYGDEGKGMVALQLALREEYAALVRTGGYNAEHRVPWAGEERTFHCLPVACLTGPPEVETQELKQLVALPAGMTFGIWKLAEELYELAKLYPPKNSTMRDRRFMVDPNAGIVSPHHIDEGQGAAKARGSTFLGVGPAMADKVRRHSFGVASYYPELGSFLEGRVAIALEAVMLQGGLVLIEGSQGTMLSLDHGHYPYCTSRNVTAMGALNDAGLPWNRVRDVWMVVKALPMRVPGLSGPSAGKELTWEEACERADRPFEEVIQTETAHGAGGKERPFEISWPELRYAAALNGPTAIALTFLDWHNYIDLGIRSLDSLSIQSRELVYKVQIACKAPVKLIRTGPEIADCIWTGREEADAALENVVVSGVSDDPSKPHIP